MNTSNLRFFNPYAEIRHTANRLAPLAAGTGSVYFVTFRLADSIPKNLTGAMGKTSASAMAPPSSS